MAKDGQASETKDERAKRKDAERQKHKARAAPVEIPKKIPVGVLNVALPPVRIEGPPRKASRLIVENGFRDDLPQVQIGARMLPVPIDFSRFADCTQFPFISERPELLIEPDMGVNLEPLDAAQYRVPPVDPKKATDPSADRMDPKDRALFAPKEVVAPVRLRQYGKTKVDTGNWLMRTIYMADAHVIAMNADENRLIRTQRNRKANESIAGAKGSQVESIEASFRAMARDPVHVDGKKGVEVLEVLPIIPDFARWPERHCVVSFENDPLEEVEWVQKQPKGTDGGAAARRAAAQGSILTIKSLVTDTGRSERFVALLAPKEEASGPVSEAVSTCRETAPQQYEWVREFNFDQKSEAGWDEPNQMLALFKGDSKAAGDRLALGGMSLPKGHTLSYVPVEKRIRTSRRVRRQGRGVADLAEVAVPREVTVKRRAPTAEEEELRESGRRRLEHPEAEEEGRGEDDERGASPGPQNRSPAPHGAADDEEEDDNRPVEDLFGDEDQD